MQSTTSDRIAVLFLDLQDNMMALVKTVGRHKLRRATSTLAELCAIHAMPAFLSSIPPGGPYLKGIVEALPDAKPRPRTVTTAFGDEGLVSDLAATGRKRVILAGIASEIVVTRTALDALAAGYEVQIAIDACGGFSDRTEAAAWSRVTASGVAMTSVVTVAGELAGDFTTELGAKTLALLQKAAGH